MTTIPDYDIQAALNDRLSDEFPAMPIAWENVSYTPTLGTPYLRAHWFPVESKPITLGSSPFIERKGFFQIDCVYPAGQGWGDARSKVAEIVAAFPPRTSFIYNGLEVNIEEIKPHKGLPGDGWYMIPTDIYVNCVYRG